MSVFSVRRSWRQPALTAAALLGLYALGGFLILPAIARPWIEKTAGGWLGRPAAVARLRLNPFSLSASVEGLAITDRDGAPLLRWDRLGVNFEALSSLVRREWVFKDVRLIGAAARLTMAQDGTLNIDDIIRSLGSPPAGGEAPGPTPAVRIHRLRIEDSSVSFVDRSTGSTFTSTFGPLRLDLSDLTTRSGEDSAYAFRGKTESGESFSWRGRMGLDPLRSEGDFTLEKVALSKYKPYYGGTVPFDIRGGTADLSSGYRFVWSPSERTLRLVGASATLRDVRLSEHEKEEIAVEAPVAEIQGADLDLLSATLSVDRFSTQGGRMILRQMPDGRVNLLDMLLPFYQTSAPAPAAAPGPTVGVGEIRFDDYTVDVEDRAPPRPVRVRLDRIQMRIFGADNVLGTPSKGILDLRWNGAGTVHVDGDVSLVGLNGDFAVKIDGIDVVPVDSYVEPVLDLRVRSGTFFAEGRTRANLIDPAHLAFSFAGDVRMDDFVAVDGARGGDLLRWKSLAMTGTDYSYQENRLRVRAIALEAPLVSIVQASDGAINLYSVLRWPQDTAEPAQDAAGASTPKPEAPASSTALAPAAPPETGPPAGGSDAGAGDTRIAHARIRAGRIRVVDQTMTPTVTLALTGIDGSLAGLSSRPGARAEVHVAARFNDTAAVTLEGQVDPLGSDVFTDLALQSRGIDLAPFEPYAARYLGYDLDRGRLDIEMAYRLEQRALKGSNLFTADPFLLGQKTQSPDATKLPVRLGLALLRDRHGVVQLDVPIEGSLDDPKFRLRRMILRALVNVFTKLVASPFTLLARAFAGKEDVDLSLIDFAPGAADLSDDGRGHLETLARGLVERPGLALLIQGGADQATDPGALRQSRLEDFVRREKWRTLGRRDRESVAPEKVAVDPGEYSRFLKRACRTLQASRPREDRGPDLDTPAAMEAWMLERIEVSAADLAALAAARASAVHDQLAASGVAPERLSLKQDVIGETARVTLELQ